MIQTKTNSKKQHSTKLFSVILLFMLPITSHSQSKQSLSEQLWERVQSCYALFEDNNDDGKLDAEIIDDTENGFLKVSGTIGTCGCSCSETIAAFKDKNGNYTFLNQEKSDCSWLHKVFSSKDLSNIFPENFSINTFIPTIENTNKGRALFYLDIDIPRTGTDTKVTLKIIPVGMNIQSDKLLVSDISDEGKMNYLQNLQFIPQLLTELSEESVQLILNYQSDKLSKKDTDLIVTTLKKFNQDPTTDWLENKLNDLKKIYDIYLSIEHSTVTLGWNGAKAKFYIKKKGEPVMPISFDEFLMNKDILRYWVAIC